MPIVPLVRLPLGVCQCLERFLVRSHDGRSPCTSGNEWRVSYLLSVRQTPCKKSPKRPRKSPKTLVQPRNRRCAYGKMEKKFVIFFCSEGRKDDYLADQEKAASNILSSRAFPFSVPKQSPQRHTPCQKRQSFRHLIPTSRIPFQHA